MKNRCFRHSAFVVAFAIVLQIHYSCAYIIRSRDAEDLPRVPGCRVLERDEKFEFAVFCNALHIPETLWAIPNNTTRLQIYGIPEFPIDRSLFTKLGNLRELELIGNNLEHFNPQILEGLSNLRSLSLKNNRIRKLPLDSFVHTPLLEKIELSQNFILTIEGVSQSLRNSTNLRTILLSENTVIRTLTLAGFAPLRGVPLQSLDLDSCGIDRIDQDAFLPLTNLHDLNLSFNLLSSMAVLNLSNSLDFLSLKSLKMSNLGKLPYFPFRFLRTLRQSAIEEIDFSNNRFINFPSTTYPVPHLRFLDMTSCNLYDLLSDNLLGMPMLETLILKKNMVPHLSYQFRNMTNLKTLDISQPMVDGSHTTCIIKEYAFQNQGNLEYLVLNGQPIRDGITRHSFHGLSRLINLDLRRCLLENLEAYTFEALHSLEVLDLSTNILKQLDNYTFYGLRSVKTINLSNNGVAFLNMSNPFSHTPALESLILMGNKINQLPQGIFGRLPNLSFIRLSDNSLTTWHVPIIPQPSNVSFLDISSNRIEYFSSEMLEDIRHLQVLDFSYNPLNCSVCGMKDLQLWMKNTSTRIRLLNLSDPELTPYSCIFPSNLANRSILEVTIPVIHCIPYKVDVLYLSVSIITPFLALFLLAYAMWYFLAWHIKYFCFQIKVRVRVYKTESNPKRYEYDAFVSYSPSDILWIRNHLVPALEYFGHDYRLCIPDRDFEASAYVTENVLGALQNSRTAIVVLSNSYLDSEWCKFDIDMAQHKLFEDTRSLIILLLEDLDNSRMTKNLKYIIKTRTFIPWTNNPVGQKLFWDRLRHAVARPDEKLLLKHIT